MTEETMASHEEGKCSKDIPDKVCLYVCHITRKKAELFLPIAKCTLEELFAPRWETDAPTWFLGCTSFAPQGK